MLSSLNYAEMEDTPTKSRRIELLQQSRQHAVGASLMNLVQWLNEDGKNWKDEKLQNWIDMKFTKYSNLTKPPFRNGSLPREEDSSTSATASSSLRQRRPSSDLAEYRPDMLANPKDLAPAATWEKVALIIRDNNTRHETNRLRRNGKDPGTKTEDELACFGGDPADFIRMIDNVLRHPMPQQEAVVQAFISLKWYGEDLEAAAKNLPWWSELPEETVAADRCYMFAVFLVNKFPELPDDIKELQQYIFSRRDASHGLSTEM
ncbi:unnamed protein product [Amoebophrya sp. A120]|nr:unnamed protein product [Amoebophrya sp. A120]|eukprot:GSA120T00018503001.1